MDQHHGSVYETGWQHRNIPQADASAGYHHQSSSAAAGAATGNATFEIHEEDIRHIMSMGFTDDQARQALNEMDGNLEFAVNYLIGLGDEPPEQAPSAQPANVPPQPQPASSEHRMSSFNNNNFSSNTQGYGGVHGRQQQSYPQPPQQPPLRDFSPHVSGIQDYGAPPQQQSYLSRDELTFRQPRLEEPLPREQHRSRSSEATAEVSRNLAQQYREMFSSSDDLDDVLNEEGAGSSSGPSYDGHHHQQQHSPAMHAEPPPNRYSNALPMDLPSPRSNIGSNALMNEYKAFLNGSDGQTPQIGANNPDSIPVSPGRHQQGYERAASPHGVRGRVRDIRNELENVERHQGGHGYESHTSNNRYERAASPHGVRTTSPHGVRTASPHGVRGRVRDIRNELEMLSTGGTTTTQNTGRAPPTARYDRGSSPHGVRNRVMDMRNNNNNYMSDPINNNNYQRAGHSDMHSSGGPPDNYGSMPLSSAGPRGNPVSTFSTNDRSDQGSRGRALPTGRSYDRDRSASPHGVRNRVMDKRHGGPEPVKSNAPELGGMELQASKMDNIGSFPDQQRTGSRGRALPTNRQEQTPSGDSNRGRGREKEISEKPKRPKKERRSVSPGKFLKNMIARKKDKEEDEPSSDSEQKPIKNSSSWGALSKLTKKKKNKSLEEGNSPHEQLGTLGHSNRQNDDATSAAVAGDATVVSMPEFGQQRGNLRKTNSRQKKVPGRTKSNDVDHMNAINVILGGDPFPDNENDSTPPIRTPAALRRQRPQSAQSGGPKSKTKSMPSNSGWQNALSAGPPSRPTRTTTEPIDVHRTGTYPNPGSSSISPPSLASVTSGGYQGTRRIPGSGEPKLANNKYSNDTDGGIPRNRHACDYRFPDPIESNVVSPTTTAKQRKEVISPNISPKLVQTKKSPTMIEISPGMKVPLIDVETTKRAIEKRMIGQQTCVDCQRVVNCVDVADFVICPHCQVVSPRQSPRRKMKMNNATRVALGFTGELEY